MKSTRESLPPKQLTNLNIQKILQSLRILNFQKHFCFITFFLHSGSSDKSISFTSPSAGFHSGNLIVPIGSSKIHCDPPKEYEPQKGKTYERYIFIYIIWLFYIKRV